MTDSPVIETTPLTFPWPVVDPFITVVRHLDLYPRGNGKLGPASAEGNLGQDASRMGTGWHMY
ncbi:MAG: hypothetical protein ACQSGP_05835 [Frankia sp.]